uniref:MYND-type domain-containing protein n=1 Tax=Knipowitschia caucasica TaxID=637954 RepID=A0AAV2MGJ0_KNICA
MQAASSTDSPPPASAGAAEEVGEPKKGNDPTALSVLTQAITGQVGFMDTEFCTTCGEKGAGKRCSVCRTVIYCDSTCQKLHWFTHKKVCKTLQEQREQREAEAAKLRRQQELSPAAQEAVEALSVKSSSEGREPAAVNSVAIVAADN